VLASLNKFYSQVLDNVKAKMTPSQTKQLINLETETTLKVRLTYTKK